MFRPFSGSSSGLYNNLESVVHVLHFISLLYRTDDDPEKGRNIVAIAKYVYTW
jgi:hypothetical protein